MASRPRKTILGEYVSPVANIFMPHAHDGGFTTGLWTKHPGSDSSDVIRRNLIYFVCHFCYRDFSVVNKDL
jgi:hypothetical protein